eukprot:3064804-Prymnesium_polylepis.2
MPAPSVEDSRGLGRCFNLMKLSISGMGMGGEAFESVVSTALTSGAMAKLTVLNLRLNKIGDKGMKAFSTALASGAMAQLKEIDLVGNQIGDEGMKAFSTALASGAMAKLASLYLSGNPASSAAQQAAKDALYHR